MYIYSQKCLCNSGNKTIQYFCNLNIIEFIKILIFIKLHIYNFLYILDAVSMSIFYIIAIVYINFTYEY